MRKKWIEWMVVGGAIAGFLVWKLSHLAFRFGDGNAYIYMAQALWQGLWPYHNFFLADPPVLILFLGALKVFLGQHLIFYQAIPILLEAGVALVLYLLLKRWSNPFATLAPALYLFSFTVLSSSDFLTGIQLVAFCSVLAIWLSDKKHPVWSGVFWALAILTKLYVLPAFIGFLIYVFWKARPQFWKLVLGAGVSGIAIMTPFLILDFSKAWVDIVTHHLHRPAGNTRLAVWSFFGAREWVAFSFAILGSFFSRRWAVILPLAALAIFFTFFQDLYFLYLGSLYFYLICLGVLLLATLWQKSRPATYWFIIFWLIAGLLSSIMLYQTDYRLRGRFLNASDVAVATRNLPDNFPLYGSHEVTPLVALLSGRGIFGNFIDTNGQAFASGALDIEVVSLAAAERGVYLLARITDIPEYDIYNSGYETFFAEDVFETACQRVQTFPSTSNETDNLIVIFRCLK